MVRIEHFALFAADAARLKDFYVAAFGLRVAVDNGGSNPPGYFLADDDGMALEIIGRPGGVSGVDTRYVCHVAFAVDDFAGARAALERAGMVFEDDTAVDNEAMTTAFFRDPEGNRCQIVRRPRPLIG
jgi:glyoxylase I family protein